MVEQILEIGYHNYTKVSEKLYKLNDMLVGIAEAEILEKQKFFPKNLEKSLAQIKQMVFDLKKGDKFPPIVIEVKNNNEFFALVDGNHRILAYKESKITEINALLVKRVEK